MGRIRRAGPAAPITGLTSGRADAVASRRWHARPHVAGHRAGLVAPAGFLAGKGLVPVLVHESEDGKVVPVETARARTGLPAILVPARVVLAVGPFTPTRCPGRSR